MAINLMKMDNRLNKLRFKLVPSKIKEIDFWSNYFYRVSLIIESQTRLNNNNNDDTTKLNNDNMNNSDDRNALMSARAYEDALDAALEDDGNLNLLDDLDDDDIDFVSDDINPISLSSTADDNNKNNSNNEDQLLGGGNVDEEQEVLLVDNNKMISSNEDFDDDLDWQKELDAELNAELSD